MHIQTEMVLLFIYIHCVYYITVIVYFIYFTFTYSYIKQYDNAANQYQIVAKKRRKRTVSNSFCAYSQFCSVLEFPF